jgi:hypothetical protein
MPSPILLISSLISASTMSSHEVDFLVFLMTLLTKFFLLRVHDGPTNCSQSESQESIGNAIMDRKRREIFASSITNNLDKNICKSLTVSVQSSVIAKLQNKSFSNCLDSLQRERSGANFLFRTHFPSSIHSCSKFSSLNLIPIGFLSSSTLKTR